MASTLTPMLFITANVGSIFEDPKRMLATWVAEVLKTVKKLQPQFLALHCQEIGGKSYEGSMKFVEDFVRRLLTSEELIHFDRIRVFLDEDFENSERFTALGNLYFVHETIKTAQIWDFRARTFVPCFGKEVHSGNIEGVPSKEKEKFPPEFFPECKWSRKGYLRTRWNINGTKLDLINIHLFHDASNFLAIEASPSIYSDYRQRALQHLVDKLQNSESDIYPFFVFGDFNFRLDTQGVVKKLTNKTIPLQVKSNKNGEISKIVYKEDNDDNKIILTVGKKEFDHHDQHENFTLNRGQWLREFDKELTPFREHLHEYPIHFPPSYPFCEDLNSATSYMKTRCPAWCDRILLSRSAKALISETYNDKINIPIQYEVIGEGVCMGDHKPVYLFFRMTSNADTFNNISPCRPKPPNNSDLYSFSLVDQDTGSHVTTTTFDSHQQKCCDYSHPDFATSTGLVSDSDNNNGRTDQYHHHRMTNNGSADLSPRSKEDTEASLPSDVLLMENAIGSTSSESPARCCWRSDCCARTCIIL